MCAFKYVEKENEGEASELVLVKEKNIYYIKK